MRRASRCRVFFSWVVVLVGVSAAAPALAATYRVGPSREYKTLQEVATLLGPGDLVEVDGNATYPGGVEIEGPASARPHRDPWDPSGRAAARDLGGNNTVTFSRRGIDTRTNHYIFEGFEVTGDSDTSAASGTRTVT